MSDTTTALGPSWLSSTPDGAVIVRRTITQYTVVELLDGHIGARPEGRRRLEYFDTRLVADHDAPIVRPGARFWLVVETMRGRPGEAYSAIAFRRPGALSPERAFADRAGAAT